MRVKELFERLQELPPEYQDALVIVPARDHGQFSEATSLGLFGVVKTGKDFGAYQQRGSLPGPSEPAIEIQWRFEDAG